MKFSPSDLKNLNYKELVVNHVEKIFFVIIGLTALYFIYGTTWKPYTKSPQQLEEIVAEGDKALKESTWPDTARKKYNNEANVVSDARNVFSPLVMTDFITNEGLYEPLIKLSKKYEEPKWLAAQDVIVSAERCPIFAVDPNKPADSEKKDDNDVDLDLDEENEEVDDNPYKRRQNVKKANRPKASRKDIERSKLQQALSSGKVALGSGLGFNKKKGNDDSKDKKRKVREPKDSYAKGHNFTIVRAIIPLQDQLNKIAESRGTVRYTDFGSDLYYDAIIERQEAPPGTTSWPSNWEEIDSTAFRKVFSESGEEYDQVVNTENFHDFLTMPLPARAMGLYGKNITHPTLKEYKLSPIEEKLIEVMNQMNEEKEIGQEEEKNTEELSEKSWDVSGFNRPNVKSLAQELSGSSNQEKMDKLIERLKEEGGEEFKDVDAEEIRRIVKEKASSEDRYLLYRFFDFDVLPGRQYRYRVRLVLKNPNYGLAPAMLSHPDVADGLTRETPWSKPSEPILVPQDSTFFLAEISPPRGLDLVKAAFQFYQWYNSSGTMIYQELAAQPGEFLGGNTKTRVLRPGPDTWEEEEIFLDSHDMLVDANPRPEFRRSHHPDLKSSQDRRRQDGLYSAALIVNEFGDLVSLDKQSNSSDKRVTKTEFDLQQEAHKEIIDRTLADEEYEKEQAEEAKKKRRRKVEDSNSK